MLPLFLDTYTVSAIFEASKRMNFLSFAISIYYTKLYKDACPPKAVKKNCIEMTDFETGILPLLSAYQ